MIQKITKQSSFLDADYICERLVPQDSFYRKFKELVTPLIKDEHFEHMYCQDNGRPAISPALLACACILQFYRGLSDREIERACTFDIEIKHALGLEMDERPFDHSTLGNFRQRLLEHGQEKMIFDRILQHLVDSGLIKKNEIQRIDATHVIADIAVPTTIRLIKRGIYDVLNMLKNRRKIIWDRVAKEIDVSEYHRKKIKHDMPGKPDNERRRNKLMVLVSDARIVLKHIENLNVCQAFTHRVELLKQMLMENVEEDDKGRAFEIKQKDKPKDLLVSSIDPDARFGAKSKTVHFVGYKANVTEAVESRFITNISATRGNVYDGDPMVSLMAQQKPFGLSPEKLIGDTAYESGVNRRNLEEEYGIKVAAPLNEKNSALKSIFPKSMFKYDEVKQTVTCPKGITTNEYWSDKRGMKSFHFAESKCETCDWQERCTNSFDGTRKIGISLWHKQQVEAEKHNKTALFKEEMKLRQPIEGKHSEMKRYHGMTRARYRGLQKVGFQFFLTATAVNIKRWMSMALEKIKPKKAILLPV
jgi:transposase